MISLTKFRDIGEKYGLIYDNGELYFDEIDLRKWVANWEDRQGIRMWNKIYIEDNDLTTNVTCPIRVTEIDDFEEEIREFSKNLKIARMELRLKQISKDFV